MKTIIFPTSTTESTRVLTGLQTIILTKQQPDFEVAKLKLCVDGAVVGECEAVSVEAYKPGASLGRNVCKRANIKEDEYREYAQGGPAWGITVMNPVRYPKPVVEQPHEAQQSDEPEPASEEPAPPPLADECQEPQPEPSSPPEDFRQESRPPRRSYKKGRNYDRE